MSKIDTGQTVEEAAHLFAESRSSGSAFPAYYQGFIAGAEWQAKQFPWIKVSDGLPDVDDYYLVTDGESISMAYFFKGWGKFAKYHKYPHPFYDDGVVKLYMPIPPISLALEGDRGILNIGEFKRKEIDYEQK